MPMISNNASCVVLKKLIGVLYHPRRCLIFLLRITDHAVLKKNCEPLMSLSSTGG
ncbi:Sphingosine kinase 2 [Labeo rohita]|uniref:Sphingosine kinase 2 n=1 Tax=Labeo rohita TaxID=84645 RepID=A0ABQ8N0H3_LABRO|nr:Sphingosine kinase 2 [Labeo rohita]